MAFTNEGGEGASLPQWATPANLQMCFDYGGPLETAKALMGYRWRKAGYSLQWLHRRVCEYDRDKAAEMAERGANAGCLVWSTGFSIENERYQWDIVRRRIGEFHDRGMHVIVYISLTNCFWQEMFAAEPDCQDWRQLGPAGEPVPYDAIDYGGGEITRYLMCVNNPHWRAYQKRRIAAAIEAGADGIFWDNNFSKCHCPICREKFRAFTAERLGAAHDIPPPAAADEAAAEADARPAAEFVYGQIDPRRPQGRLRLAESLFRHHCILDILRELRQYTLSLKPDAIWSNNGHLCQDIYDSANVLLSEDLVPVGLEGQEGILRTNAGMLRYLYEEGGRATPAIVNSRHPETFAYGCTSYRMRDPRVNALLAVNAELYADARSVARVAVVADQMNVTGRGCRFFDNLVANHILFDVIPAHRLWAFELGGYDVIVLRGVLYLSDKDCGRLREFVAAGGSLIATGDSSLYDQSWARRADYGLADVFGVSAGAADKPERIEHGFGRGISILYPRPVEAEMRTDPDGPSARAIAADVRGHLSDPIIEVDAPAGVAVNVMAAAAGLVVHVLNYAAAPAAGVTIRITPGPHLRGKLRKVVPLGDGSAQATDIATSSAGLQFTLAKIDKYTAVLIG